MEHSTELSHPTANFLTVNGYCTVLVPCMHATYTPLSFLPEVEAGRGRRLGSAAAAAEGVAMSVVGVRWKSAAEVRTQTVFIQASESPRKSQGLIPLRDRAAVERGPQSYYLGIAVGFAPYLTKEV